MKKIILLVVLLFIVTSFMPLDGQWVKIYGDNDGDDAYFIQQTSDGGYVVAGGTHFNGRLMVLKLDSNGSVEWKSSYWDSYYKNPVSFLQMSDGGYIFVFHAGMNDPDDDYKFKDTLLITKLSQGGSYVSPGSIGRFINNDEHARAFQPTDDGGYILAGNTRTYGAGEEDIWVSKLTSTGDIEWQQTYGGSDYDRINSIQETSDGGYVLASDTRSFGSSEDILVIKLTSAGNVEWQRTYGGGYSDKACSVKQTSGGGYVLAGNTQSFGAGGEDIWIIKLSFLGDIEWQQAYGGSGDDSVSSIQQTSDGGYVIGGTTNSFGEGGDDFWIMKLSAVGDIEWQKTFGTSSGEISHALQQTSDGGYIASGTISSYGSGSSDFLVLKLLQDGNIDSPCKFLQDSSAQVAVTTVSPTDTSINPLYSDVIRELVDPNLYSYGTDAVEYELCSVNPLLTIHSTSGGTTDPPPGTSTHVLGEGVTVTAIPDSGAEFTGWSGDATGTGNPIVMILDSDKSIAANFFIHEYTLYIAAGEGGTTDPEPGIHKDAPGTDIVVTAIPEGGFQFSEWSGDVIGTENPVTITLDSNKSVAANFTEISDEGGDIFRLNCFIATAAYDSPYHPHVEVLREFRDEYLLTNWPGRKCVNIYYRVSPQIAAIISKNKPLRIVVRVHLLPLIAFSYSMVCLGPAITAVLVVFVFGFPILFGVTIRRRTKKKFKKISF